MRPTNPRLAPEQLPPGVSYDMRRLYDLVWRRALACQMASAETLQVRLCVRVWGGRECCF